MKKYLLILFIIPLLFLPMTLKAKGAEFGIQLSLPGHIIPELDYRKMMTEKSFYGLSFGMTWDDSVLVTRTEAGLYTYLQENFYAGTSWSLIHSLDSSLFSFFNPALGMRSPVGENSFVFFEASFMWFNYLVKPENNSTQLFFIPVLKAGINWGV